MNSKLNKSSKVIELEKYNDLRLHSCIDMDFELSKIKSMLHYSKMFREYGINVPESTGCILMDYCMFCGKKLPISVRKYWYSILEYEYNVEDPDGKDKKLVPEEFLTDEWWKRRKL